LIVPEKQLTFGSVQKIRNEKPFLAWNVQNHCSSYFLLEKIAELWDRAFLVYGHETANERNVGYNLAPLGFGKDKLHFLVVPKTHKCDFRELSCGRVHRGCSTIAICDPLFKE